MDLVEMFERSANRFGALVGQVGEHQWGDPTPCDGWDVRTLVNHVTAEQCWAPHLVAGEHLDQVGDRYEGDVLGEDPPAAWEQAAGLSIASFAQPGALDRTVHLSYGEEACSEYLLQMLTDIAVHGWDLARAIGVDATIDTDVAEHLVEEMGARREMLRSSGLFADSVPVPPGSGPTDRLVALLGRRP